MLLTKSVPAEVLAMVRAQVQLTDRQARRLRAMARREQTSVSEVIRRAVDRAIEDSSPGRNSRYARAATLVGAFKDPAAAADLSERHDDYLDEALG
jgi:metal-responsive CopG/Arc/MetJ family transcriptional regulator